MNTSATIRTDAIELLEERYEASDRSLDFADWALNISKREASFYSWLFPDADNINDFGAGMSLSQVQASDRLLQQIEVLQDIRDNN